MPRGRSGASAKKGVTATRPPPSKPPHVLLRSCLDALLQDIDPACLGNELECGCCIGGGLSSDVVDSLCAFCLHSEAARNFFVSAGGLEALLLAGQSRVETTASNAFQVLSCLSVSADTQRLVLSSKPQLLILVSQMAAAEAAQEDREGLQHAALCLLASWVQDSGSPFSSWIMQQQVVGRMGGGDLGQSAVQQGQMGYEMETQPMLIHAAMRALTHPSLVIRKAAARLFVSTAAAAMTPTPSNPLPLASRGSIACTPLAPNAHPLASSPLMSACVHDASVFRQQLQELLQISATRPRFEEFAAWGRAIPDPVALMAQQDAQARQKLLCHGLLHLVAELCTAGPVGRHVLQQAQLAPLALQLFCCAWGIGCPSAAGAPGRQQHGIAHSAATATRCPALSGMACIQDHQSRELALDTLLAVLGHPIYLPLLVPPAYTAQQQEAQRVQQSMAGRSPGTPAIQGSGAPVSSSPWSSAAAATAAAAEAAETDTVGIQGVEENGAEAGVPPGGSSTQLQHEDVHAAEQEEGSLQVLLAVVEQLLRQQTAAHVRGALSILGHVQFSSARDHGPPTATGERVGGKAVQSHRDAAARELDAALGCSAAAAQPGAPGAAAATAAAAAAAGAGGVGARSAWMQLLCSIFDAAWASEVQAALQQPEQLTLAPASAPTAAPQPLVLYPTPSPAANSTAPLASGPIVLYPPASPAANPAPPPPLEPIVLYPPGMQPPPQATLSPAPEPIVLYPPRMQPTPGPPPPSATGSGPPPPSATKPIVLYPPGMQPMPGPPPLSAPEPIVLDPPTSPAANPAPTPPPEPIVLYPPGMQPTPGPPPPLTTEPIVLYPPASPAANPAPTPPPEPIVLYPPGMQPTPGTAAQPGMADGSPRPSSSIASPQLSNDQGLPLPLGPGQLKHKRAGSRSSSGSRGSGAAGQLQGGRGRDGPGPGRQAPEGGTGAQGRGRGGMEARGPVVQPQSWGSSACDGGSSQRLQPPPTSSSVASQGAVVTQRATSQAGAGGGSSTLPAEFGPRACLDLGLGYRVLVQVLGAWRQLQDSQQAAVLAAMDATDWRARAQLALGHPKHLVVSAASKLLGGHDADRLLLQDAEEAQACLQQLAAMQASGAPPGQQQPAPAVLQPPVPPQVEWSNQAFAAALEAMGLPMPSNLHVAPMAAAATGAAGTGSGPSAGGEQQATYAPPCELADEPMALSEDMQEFLEAFLGSDDAAEEAEEDGEGGRGREEPDPASGNGPAIAAAAAAAAAQGGVGQVVWPASVAGTSGRKEGEGSGAAGPSVAEGGLLRGDSGSGCAPGAAGAPQVSAQAGGSGGGGGGGGAAAAAAGVVGGGVGGQGAGGANAGAGAGAAHARPAAAAAAAEEDEALFLPWDACGHQTLAADAAQRDLADALTLLPDFDQLAANLLAQHGGMPASEVFPFQLDLAAMML